MVSGSPEIELAPPLTAMSLPLNAHDFGPVELNFKVIVPVVTDSAERIGGVVVAIHPNKVPRIDNLPTVTFSITYENGVVGITLRVIVASQRPKSATTGVSAPSYVKLPESPVRNVASYTPPV